MTPSRIFLFLAFFFFSTGLFAQDRLGKAPFFATFNARKLSAALTDGLPNDSLKALSIYLWTVHHVRYDVRAFSKGRMSYMQPKKILRHRKAYCIGYSILYDSLCAYAGVDAQVVIGYDYDPWYEARDTFFINDHAWNAVYVDGQWQLLDLTWASGYIKPRKQILRRILGNIFGIPFRQKYRFIRKQNDFYYCTPPELFVHDHLPGTPAWQLLPCSVPLDSFQRSPTAVMHFLRDSTKNCLITGNDSIGKILAEPDLRQMLEAGKQAMYYNKNNCMNVSYGYSIYAEELVKQGRDEANDRALRILVLDSAAKQYDSASLYFRRTYGDYKKQEHFFLNRNKRMREQMIDLNKAYYRKQHRYANVIRAEWAFVKSHGKTLRRNNHTLNKASRKFQQAHFRTKRPDKPAADEAQQTRILLDRIDSNNRAIALTADSLRKISFTNSTGDFVRYDSSVIARIATLDKQIGKQNAAIFLRYFYQLNDYDTVMIHVRDSIFVYERQMDSLYLLIPPGKDWPANKNNREYAAKVKRMDRLITENAKICRKLAKMTETSFSEDSAFTAECDRYRAWNDSVIAENNRMIGAYRAYASSLHQLKRMHRHSARRCRKEMHAEDYRFICTNSLFRYHFGGYAIAMKRNANNCKKMKAQAKREAKKLKEEEKKEAKQ